MKTCLIVDDSSAIRRIIRRIFEEIGFTCAKAEDGSKALEACDRAMPDLVMLDWNMPVMNGLDFLKKLRSTPKGKNPIVLFCTTENSMETISAGIAAGANEYIMKPFDMEIIQSKLRQVGVLENSRA